MTDLENIAKLYVNESIFKLVNIYEELIPKIEKYIEN